MQEHTTENGAQQTTAGGADQLWEREVLTRLAMASLNEQRRARRWRVIISVAFLGFFALFLVILAGAVVSTDVSTEPHSAVVRVDGIISAATPSSADALIKGLQAAFKNEYTRGVILRVNSPGGSPVQSAFVYDEILRLRAEYPNIPIYAVIEDMGTSGAYYIAVAAEKIYASGASIVGSIGVRMDSFGFVDALQKLGVERRLMTAGEHKGMLDPFSPELEQDKQHIQRVLDEIHLQFINAVKSQRGDRVLESENPYSGLLWTGERGVEVGLIDELGSTQYVAKEVIGEETIRDFTHEEDPLARALRRMGTVLAQVIESRAQPRLQ